MTESAEVEVFLDGTSPTKVGTAYFHHGPRGTSTTFAYDPTYLGGGGFNIDPSLVLVSGSQHYNGPLPAFSDAAPGRWGRNLINRDSTTWRRARELDEVDYLLAVNDDTRQGALRFKPRNSDTFVGPPSVVPPFISLPTLLHTAREVADSDEYIQAVKVLLDTGTSALGGARPKASILCPDGSLGIAKFPHASDDWDVIGWEYATLLLAHVCGLDVPDFRLVPVTNANVLVLRRFDRSGAFKTNNRIPFISAMTACSSTDGMNVDYVEVAGAIRELSGGVQDDLTSLFTRVVFFVAIGNTDDHLRNLGFLHHPHGWRFSPLYDVNPNPNIRARRSTSLLGATTFPEETEALLEFSSFCGLKPDTAKNIISRVIEAVSSWKDVARTAGLAAREVKRMEQNFNLRIEALRKQV